MQAVSAAASFVAGYACRSQCGSMPCGARVRTGGGRPFKLSVTVHSAALNEISGPGMVHDQRPYVVIGVRDKTKETELGDWSSDGDGQWCFKETITLEVMTSDELSLDVGCSTRYQLWVASVTLTSKHIGEAAFPVFSVLTRLVPEDRDDSGIVYVTPIIPFDVVDRGRVTARVYLSFETNQAPPPRGKSNQPENCWGCAHLSSGCNVGEVPNRQRFDGAGCNYFAEDTEGEFPWSCTENRHTGRSYLGADFAIAGIAAPRASECADDDVKAQSADVDQGFAGMVPRPMEAHSGEVDRGFASGLADMRIESRELR
eukprot:TRINITY_DN40370_c0_g1_i1.p1 TRINITY_DN40370_c0_g1~~TRINITY_DN40370_c0_g1_i1.p1  ORF type:complete len:315 (+),score=37.57 TRINITY_DN40370_c0_g1_i1:208-1152(+)